MQDARERVVVEAAVRAALEACECARARVRVDRAERLDHGGEEVVQREILERLSGILDRILEDALRPCDVFLGGRGVPLGDDEIMTCWGGTANVRGTRH